jgi:hypothetical protein
VLHEPTRCFAPPLTFVAFGFIAAFSSAVVFMAIFLIGLIFVIDKNGIVPANGELAEFE